MIKVEVEDLKENNEISYPCLMENTIRNGLIVLFTGESEGTVINPAREPSWSVGEHSCTWAMPCFKPYNKKVVLYNEQ